MPDIEWNQQRHLLAMFDRFVRAFPQLPVVVSEGDSWFSFPSHRNTIDWLDEMVEHNMSLLRLESSGDTLANMTGATNLSFLESILKRYPVDVLLFSGGGNDVVGPELLALFDRVPDGADWRDHFAKSNDPNFELAVDRTFDTIARQYNTLINMRDRVSPGTLILTHGYDYVDPSGKPTIYWIWPIPLHWTGGPWIKNHLEERNIRNAVQQNEVVHYLIDRFNVTLQSVQARRDNFIALDNRDLIQGDWSDELHPTREGFKRVAGEFLRELKNRLPAKFPG